MPCRRQRACNRPRDDLLAEIRRLTDREALCRLVEDVGLEAARDEERIVAIWGAYEGGRLVGGVGLEDFLTLHLVCRLVVAEDRRDRGIGTALLHELEEEVRLRRADDVWAMVTEPGFFMRRGYSMVGGGGERELLLAGRDSGSREETASMPRILRKTL